MNSYHKMDLKYIINKQYVCTVCGRGFQRKCDLDRHSNNTHGDAAECLLCSKSLKSGNRRDVRVRHLMLGCPKFKENFKLSDMMEKAKKHADEYFKITHKLKYAKR
eukprot:NODE_329_length_10886_cov_0.296653.p7 type:complete len:106 gc:universal NODE_329_length_10886_cov_0.296653:10588-10271(-)